MAINQWRATRIFAPGVKKTYLDRLMAKADKLTEAARLASVKSTAIANKAAYALTQEGIAESNDKKLKQDLAAARKKTKDSWLCNPENAGKKYTAPRAPPKPKVNHSNPRKIACSYCALEWFAGSTMPWIKCNVFSHDKCDFHCCGSDVCLRAHTGHLEA